jgi:hypothetical protein
MSLLMPQHALDWIPHPYGVCTKCFICCVWAYGATLTFIHLCKSGWQSGVDFGVWGVDLSGNDVVMSLLRLKQASGWTPHPYWMYIKPFGTLILCCVWAYGATLTVMHLCRYGVGFGVWVVDLRWYDVVIMSLLRLQQASDCIPHPYWIYTKPFGTLICCVWAYGATLTGMHLCRSGVDFGVLGARMICCYVILASTGFRLYIPHPCWMCIQSLLVPWYAVYGHMGLGAPLCHNTCAAGVVMGGCIFRFGVRLSPELGCGVWWLRI